MLVGGDLYDVVPVPDGCGVVVADVCGKGAAAAALTALIRHTVRAEIHHGLGPAAVLERLNRAMLRASGERPGRFATVAQAQLTCTPTGATVRLASAGHPPPLVVRGGRAEPVSAPGTLLGIYPDVTLTEVTFELHRGEIMVLYTDGVTEARDAVELYGSERLAHAVAAGGPADELADRVLADVDAFQHWRQRDDIAVLVIEASRGAVTGTTPEVALTGELDIATYEDAREQLAAAERTAPELLVVDLSGLRFVDSTGVRLILSADERARQAGRRVALRLGDGLARRVFDALGLLDRLDVLDAP